MAGRSQLLNGDSTFPLYGLHPANNIIGAAEEERENGRSDTTDNQYANEYRTHAFALRA
jgi:hypothetical protein